MTNNDLLWAIAGLPPDATFLQMVQEERPDRFNKLWWRDRMRAALGTGRP